MTTTVLDTTPGRIDITIQAGSPFSLTIPLTDAGGDVAAADVESARAHVRTSIGGQDILHIFSTEDDPADLEVTGSTAASLVLSATGETTSLWQTQWPGQAPETVAWFDVEITDTDGETHQVTRPGTITLVHQVTR